MKISPSAHEERFCFGCRCQTYEGGIGGEPGAEAHGGYVTFCGMITGPTLNIYAYCWFCAACCSWC